MTIYYESFRFMAHFDITEKGDRRYILSDSERGRIAVGIIKKHQAMDFIFRGEIKALVYAARKKRTLEGF